MSPTSQLGVASAVLWFEMLSTGCDVSRGVSSLPSFSPRSESSEQERRSRPSQLASKVEEQLPAVLTAICSADRPEKQPAVSIQRGR